MFISEKIKIRYKKGEWYDVRDGFWIAWFVAFAILGLIGGHKLGFLGAGINLGMAIERIGNRKIKRMIEASRRQDVIDLRTMAELAEKMSYDMLHKMEKGGLN